MILSEDFLTLASASGLPELAQVKPEVIGILLDEFTDACLGDESSSGLSAFREWLWLSPLDRHAKTPGQVGAAAALRDLFLSNIASLPSSSQSMMRWFFGSYSQSERRAERLAADNKHLRQVLGAAETGKLPVAHHLRAIQVWPWCDVPSRLELAAPEGPTPSWVMLYRQDADPTHLAALRRGLQTAPHAPCVRTVSRRRAEFLW